MRIKRRDFLKTGAVGGAAVTVGWPALNAFARKKGNGGMGERSGRWIATTCQGCTTWCPIEVFVQEVCESTSNPANCDARRAYDDAERYVLTSTGNHMSRLRTMVRSSRKYQLR